MDTSSNTDLSECCNDYGYVDMSDSMDAFMSACITQRYIRETKVRALLRYIEEEGCDKEYERMLELTNQCTCSRDVSSEAPLRRRSYNLSCLLSRASELLEGEGTVAGSGHLLEDNTCDSNDNLQQMITRNDVHLNLTCDSSFSDEGTAGNSQVNNTPMEEDNIFNGLLSYDPWNVMNVKCVEGPRSTELLLPDQCCIRFEFLGAKTIYML